MVVANSQETIARCICPHDCPDTCSMVVSVRDGRAVRIRGDADHPFTRGFLCVKVNNYLDRVYSSERVLYPMRRVGAKGECQFERTSWDDAVDTIATKFKDVVDRYGPEAILPYSYAGTMGLLNYASMDRRFFNRLGASQLERTICSSAGAAGYGYTIGGSIGTDPEMFADSRLIILWGANPVSSNVHLVPMLKEASRKGARIVVIDPRRSRSAALCDTIIQPRPGTDGALALGIMHVLIREDLIDHDYIQRHTLGFEQLAERVSEFTPETVADLTGVPTEDILSLARLYGTTRPAVIRVNYGMQRNTHGGMAVRTIACLPALVGAWRDAAGGILLSTSGSFGLNRAALERADLIRGEPRRVNMVRIGEALTTLQPPIKALYVYNSNPAAVAPKQASVLAGLRRDDLFVAVHEQIFTDTCRFADIILPATTTLEQTDLHSSYGHLYLQLNRPAIAPVGEARANVDVFRQLAQRMGFDEPCFRDTDDDLIRQALASDHPHLGGITYERLREEGSIRLNVARPFVPFAQGGFQTPSGRCEFYSEVARRDGFDPLPTYEPPDESPAGSPGLHARYPIELITPAAHHFLNSTFSHLPKMQALEGRPTIELDPNDAAARGIATGDRVRVFNDRGSIHLFAVVSDAVQPGVAAHTGLWWLRDGEEDLNCNALTSDATADMGGGATFHTNLVQVERA
jgi:anaerobic selenocysteine-containing dehydrogenase